MTALDFVDRFYLKHPRMKALLSVGKEANVVSVVFWVSSAYFIGIMVGYWLF